MSTATIERDLTWEEADASLRKSEDRFMRNDVEGILSRYADDVVIRFADLKEIRGKVEAEKFLRARFDRQADYWVRKELILVSGQKYGNNFTARWTDRRTGVKYEARGTEILQLRDGKVVAWDCGYSVWEAGKVGEQGYFAY